MRVLLWMVLLVGLGAVGLGQGRAPLELVAAWEGLDEGDRKDCVDWFLAECDRGGGFRGDCERFVLRAFEGDPFDWPDREELPRFDPKVHAPAQVIPRRFIDESKARWARDRSKLIGAWTQRDFVPAFQYDWARGTVVKMGDWQDPARIAANAAQGFTPYTDLVEALVERTMDDGSVRDEAVAFGHAYADRSGNTFPTVTLYDAWCSGNTLEMPDVECLGIVHMLDDDWKSWVAPVPGGQQQPLYQHIGKHFSKLRRHRALRTTLARLYVAGTPPLPLGYETAAVRFHGFWELNSSDPAKLALDLPSDKQWTKWLTKRGQEVDQDGEVVARARARQAALLESRAWAKRTFEGILKEYGAFDPKPVVEEKAEDGDSAGGGGGNAARDARTP